MKKISLLFVFSILFSAGNGASPDLSFYCELRGTEFNDLFTDTALIRELVDMNVSLRIGLHDFSTERTTTIQKLNEAGIPLVAWLLLPEEDGYWFNMHNGEKAEKRYADFKKWTSDNNLKWEGIGIDLEPDMNDGKLFFSHPWKLVWKVYKRLYDNKSLKEATNLYQELIDRMKNDGFHVESYLIPFIFDERELKTTSLQKLMGIVDIKTDSEIPMLYTSAMGNSAIIPLYHRDNMPIALGSTGGGVEVNGIELASLTWDNLEKDLLIASKLTDDIHIFSLEGTLQKGFLKDIKNLDFNRNAPDISVQIIKQKKFDKTIRFLLVILNHPFWLAFVILAIISVILFGVYKLITLLIRLFINRNVQKKSFLTFILLIMLTSAYSQKSVSVVSTVDLNRYKGYWYEIARLPNFFERKLKCTSATYTLRDDGKITVLNKGNYISDPEKTSSIKGIAWIPDKNSPARLKVQFFWPFSADYWILYLDKDYRYALIGEPALKYL